MKVRFSIPVFSLFEAIASDFKISLKEIVEERHLEHFTYTFTIVGFSFIWCACFQWFDLHNTGWVMPTIFGGILGGSINAIREGYLTYMGEKNPKGFWNIPYSWRDVRFGTYGGILGGLFSGLLIYFLL